MKSLNLIAAALLAISSQVVAQGNFSCSGNVNTVGISPTTGVLSVDAGHGVHYLCSFTQEMNGVNSETCKAWYSMFLSAQAANKQVIQYYSALAGANCSTLGTWAVPSPFPYFVSLDQ